MSDVNKLDSTPCSFDPDQYKKKIDIEVDDVAPAGSFPWAIIQVYLKKLVRRSSWNSNLYLIPEYDNSGNLTYIQQSDADGNPSTWVPEPKDMLACDWELVKIKPKPVECMLSFELEVGTSQYDNGDVQDWGYLLKGGSLGAGEYPFGTLTNLHNTIGIGSILEFILSESPIGTFDFIQLQVDTQNQSGLENKALEVVVNGSTYNLVASKNSLTTDFLYYSDGAKQLGDLLKQNVGKTLSFCLNWK
ncbi:hypothetical protein Xsto_04139 [Xenorhabdus stockiae]|uniref:DUF2829 domain-containing protein n=1 Tax=Xenorhabdus stockiae TaxID=351614 RepID=A0A2D0K3U4_9GAMM|nr:MW1434 family type I TA system toxin [Xenorhabdus stockiae]PHM56703.1 hypothetical protein Xsto_04139 [Xenorhabdus stockiae]